MINIDQDALCDFCKDYHDSNMSMCEGTQCEKITEIYLDDKGITEDDPNTKTFRKLNIGDKFYLLVHDQITPEIKVCIVNSLSQMNCDKFRVHYESTGFYVDKDKEDSCRTHSHFLYRKDCEKALQEICIKRIVALSKIIGSIE